MCSPYHFLHFALENFSFFMFPMGLIFFSASAIIASLNPSLLHLFSFMIKGLPKSFLNFLLVTIENYFRRRVFHRASMLFLFFLLFPEFIDFM